MSNLVRWWEGRSDGEKLALAHVLGTNVFSFAYNNTVPWPITLHVLLAFANILGAAVIAIVFRLLISNATAIADATSEQVWITVATITFYFVLINTSLFVFNLLPVPPLDGWAVLMGLVDNQTHWKLRQLQARYAQFIPIIFLVIILAGGRVILGPIIDSVFNTLIGR